MSTERVSASGADRHGRLLMASNRLPIVLTRTDTGGWLVEPGSGGLVTALAPILRDRGGLWIGWTGVAEVPAIELSEPIESASRDVGYELRPAALSQEEVDGYYYGFSNEVVWPLFHDLQGRCNFDPAYWRTYQVVNQKFAEAIIANYSPGDYVWVHDYHLMLVAKELKQRGAKGRFGFFLHTPFPPLDIFVKLPWRLQVLEALMEYDLIGFQTVRDRNNFLGCVEAFMRGLHPDSRRRLTTVVSEDWRAVVGSFPISIDFDEFDRMARDPDVIRRRGELRQILPDGQIILGVDRLDYSKGIPERLRAYRRALERFERLRGQTVLVQVVVPSRENIPEYQRLRREIESLVGEINRSFTQPGWVPVHYIHRSLDRPDLVAYYRAADIALVTPLKDGMNLIAKEYCAANIDNNGVLILSEFAGAAQQLGRNALLVNPYHIEAVADAINRACRMEPAERESRMRRLRASVRRYDIFWWVRQFLSSAAGKEGEELPQALGPNLLNIRPQSWREVRERVG